MPLFDINYNKRDNLWEIDTDIDLSKMVLLGEVTECIYDTEVDTWIILNRDNIYIAFENAHRYITNYLQENKE